MSLFQTYLELGFWHISDWNAYDHMLFLVALCAVYQIQQWKDILILVTAFTIGHSVSLAIATLGLIDLNMILPLGGLEVKLSKLIEFLIPVTILVTAVYHYFQSTYQKTQRFQYFMALFFGLIHGLGFSNYLQSLLGGEESIFMPLLAFNIGIELGQILIVVIIMGISYILVQLLKLPHRIWFSIVSSLCAFAAFYLAIEAKFW